MTPSSIRQHAAGESQDLRRIPATGLYEPVTSVRGQQMWFLLGNPSDAPDILAFEQIWSGEAVSTHPGYLLFFNIVPPTAQAAAVEAELRRKPEFQSPSVTGFGWLKAVVKKDSVTLTVATLLRCRANAFNQPCVDGDTPLILTAGIENLVFPDGALCIAQRNEGRITAIATTYQPQEHDPAPNGFGVVLPLAGPLTGCVCFAGLSNTPGSGSDPARQRKSLMNVSIDPLNPLGSARNYRIYTGKDFILSGQQGSYRLDPA